MPTAERTEQRAYAFLSIRAVDEEKRIIEGIATTPALARDGDILVTEGIEFKLPIPFLFGHKSDLPLGNVVSAERTPEGIHVRIQVAPAGVAAFIDEKWRLIKAGVVRGLSIGWRTLEETFDKVIGGFRITRSEWLELSAVPVPADPNATILSVRSADAELLAASGRHGSKATVVRLNTNLPGVSGQPTRSPMKKPIREQIQDFENKRAATVASLDQIMTRATDEGRTLNETETQEHDNLSAEVRAIDEHIKRLREHETLMATTAQPVTPAAGASPNAAAQSRTGVIQVKSNLPPGIGMARTVIAQYRARKEFRPADQIAREMWPDQPEVADYIVGMRSIVEAGDTTTSGWASQLVPNAMQLGSEFLDMFRAKTIIGRIPGLRKVPFNVAIPIRTAGGTFQWVGEAAAKPVTSETFTSVSLRWAKASGIIVITEELARFSNPAAEMVIRDSMIESLTRFFDTQFVSTTAEVSNVSPAGILNGISATSTTGTSAATFRTDMNNMLNNFTANTVPLSGIVLLMSDTQAVALSLMVTDLGVPLFPNIGQNGGSILGFPVVVSENVGTKIIAIKADNIFVAEDPAVRVDVSDQATIEMETVPAIGEQSPPSTQSVLKSMYQNNLIALRAEQYRTWKVARAAAVEYINGNAYVP